MQFTAPACHADSRRRLLPGGVQDNAEGQPAPASEPGEMNGRA